MAASRFMATWSRSPRHHFFLQAGLSSRMGLGRSYWCRRLDDHPTVGRKLTCSLVKNLVQDDWMSGVLMSQTATGIPDIRSCEERLSATSSARQSFRADGLTRHPLNTQPKKPNQKKTNLKECDQSERGKEIKTSAIFLCQHFGCLYFHVIVSLLLFVLSCLWLFRPVCLSSSCNMLTNNSNYEIECREWILYFIDDDIYAVNEHAYLLCCVW